MAKHFLIYYQQGTGTYIVTAPKSWARENQNHFRGIDFENQTLNPTPEVVENYLIANYGFQEMTPANERVSLVYNFNPDLIIPDEPEL